MKKLLVCILLISLTLPVCLAQTGVYRALCVAFANYDDGRVRLGGINSAQGLYDCLSRCFGSRGSFASLLSVDLDKEELTDLIHMAFQDAQEGDVSLLYITAHGGEQGGVCWIETREGARLYPHELESILSDIPGSVILLVDACNSGGFTGKQSAFARQFSGSFLQSAFSSTKYTVIASCYLDENSYRISSGDTSEESISTAFARSFCEGLGWDLINDRSTELKADKDLDRRVSFAELIAYVRRRSMFYLSSSRVSVQTVNATGANPGFLLADRNPREY